MAVLIGDAQFMSQLTEIRKIKQFLFEERVPIPPAYLPAIDLGELNDFSYGTSGRAPTEEEWALLDAKLTALITMLDDNQRWKMRVHELGFFFKTMPLIFLGCSVFFAAFYVLYQTFRLPDSPLRAFLFLFSVFGWTVSQGAMGACAFLGVSASNHKPPSSANATDVVVSDNVDLTNRNLLTIRIVLGAVFAFLLGAPISFQGLDALSGTFQSQVAREMTDPSTYALILAPFLFGFSTSLVLALLNRVLETLKTLIGVNRGSTTP
ncbi:MAG: hypothetical protein KIT25_07885 [Enhydrobacter sp.]|nr:MAG: hypothetical protein KIT25_07885 [Enhydrobacter sp.]